MTQLMSTENSVGMLQRSRAAGKRKFGRPIEYRYAGSVSSAPASMAFACWYWQNVVAAAYGVAAYRSPASPRCPMYPSQPMIAKMLNHEHAERTWTQTTSLKAKEGR